jgi:phosphoadenosine phosphosulfate reductase
MIEYGRRASRIQKLTLRYSDLDGEALLRPVIEREFRGRIAVVSSFGAESAIGLALVAAIDPRTPVLFLDTGKLFSQTLRYRDRLVAELRLEDVRTIHPEPRRLAEADPENALWLTDPDQCCVMRKVEPLERAFSGFDAWISGRKRYHGAARACLPLFENAGDGRVKINPVAGWSRERVKDEFAARSLPRHPLEAQGYLSISCITCTDRVCPGEDQRAGRWRPMQSLQHDGASGPALVSSKTFTFQKLRAKRTRRHSTIQRKGVGFTGRGRRCRRGQNCSPYRRTIAAAGSSRMPTPPHSST